MMYVFGIAGAKKRRGHIHVGGDVRGRAQPRAALSTCRSAWIHPQQRGFRSPVSCAVEATTGGRVAGAAAQLGGADGRVADQRSGIQGCACGSHFREDVSVMQLTDLPFLIILIIAFVFVADRDDVVHINLF